MQIPHPQPPSPKWGPFNGETSGKAIMKHLKDEVFPSEKAIQELSLKVADYRQGFWNSFFRRGLTSLQEEYRIANRRFLSAYHVYQTPDELFKDVNTGAPVDPKDTAIAIMDYAQTQNAVKPHFDSGFALLEVMDRTLSRASQSADQRVATTLSLIAIAVTLILGIVTVVKDSRAEIQFPLPVGNILPLNYKG